MKEFESLLERLSPVQQLRFKSLLNMVEDQAGQGILTTDEAWTRYEKYAEQMASIIEAREIHEK